MRNKMKLTFLILIFAVSHSFAASILCKPKNRFIKKEVILNQMEGSQITPFTESLFELLLLDTSKKGELGSIVMRTIGKLRADEFFVEFQSRDERVSFMTYTSISREGRLIFENNQPLRLKCSTL
jgi:hypothetical protein